LPAGNVEVANVAIPPFRGAVPRVVEPSWKVTLPVAEAGLTVAVMVTAWPKGEGAGVTERVVVVVDSATDSVTGFEVLAPFRASPP
jgi:hypothetical protein